MHTYILLSCAMQHLAEKTHLVHYLRLIALPAVNLLRRPGAVPSPTESDLAASKHPQYHPC